MLMLKGIAMPAIELYGPFGGLPPRSGKLGTPCARMHFEKARAWAVIVGEVVVLLGELAPQPAASRLAASSPAASGAARRAPTRVLFAAGFIEDLARWLNPIVAGWINYYGRYYRTVMNPLLQRVNTYLRRWAGRKYRRLGTIKRFKRWWTGLLNRAPGLFAHWRVVRSYS
jgi:group II intron maturase